MPKTIYVPQGYAATVDNFTKELGIEGLFTNDFSSCNILIIRDQESITLMHLDTRNIRSPTHILNALKEKSNEAEIFVIYKKPFGIIGHEELLSILRGYKISSIEASNDGKGEGVYISLKDKKIELFEHKKLPEEILHHPKERKILSERKMMTIIGHKDRQKNGRFPNFPIFIFNQQSWLCHDGYFESYMAVDSLQDEMNTFADNDTFFDFQAKLKKIVLGSDMKIKEDLDDFVSSVTPYLETYLYQCNYKEIFFYNMVATFELFAESLYKIRILTKEDESIFQRFQAICMKYYTKVKDGFFDEASLFFKNEKKADTEFFNSICEYYAIFKSHYESRKNYVDRESIIEKEIAAATKMSEEGQKKYNDKNYTAAENLFRNALIRLTNTCVETNTLLPKAYYFLGRNLYFSQQYESALPYLIKSAELVKLHENTSNNEMRNLTLNIKKMLSVCDEKLEEKKNYTLQPK